MYREPGEVMQIRRRIDLTEEDIMLALRLYIVNTLHEEFNEDYNVEDIEWIGWMRAAGEVAGASFAHQQM